MTNRPFCICLTKLSGTEKTTQAVEVNNELVKRYDSVVPIDGDDFCKGLTCYLGF